MRHPKAVSLSGELAARFTHPPRSILPRHKLSVCSLTRSRFSGHLHPGSTHAHPIGTRDSHAKGDLTGRERLNPLCASGRFGMQCRGLRFGMLSSEGNHTDQIRATSLFSVACCRHKNITRVNVTELSGLLDCKLNRIFV